MWKCALILWLAACAGPNLAAQSSLPNATVGVPYIFDFAGDLSELQGIFAEEGVEFSLTFTVASGTLPPGLSFSNGVFSGTPSAAGLYSFTVAERFLLVYQGETLLDETFPQDVSIQVDGFSGPALSTDTGALTFAFTIGSTAVESQSFSILNRGSSTQTFTATAGTISGGPWLTVSPSGGTAAFGSTPVSANVNPSTLGAGTYSGMITISLAPSGQTIAVSVVATVSGSEQQIQLSQTGFRFQTVVGGGTPPPQPFALVNGSAKSLSFSVSASTLSGGQGWLSVAPASGTVGSKSSSVLTVSVKPTGLPAGDYYGQVQVSAPGVDNSPQIASVVLNVAEAGTDLGAFLQPTGLIFIGQAGGANPGAQNVALTNPSPSDLMFGASPSFQPGSNKLTVQPLSGSVSAANPIQISVQPNTSGLAAGIYTGDLALYFSNNTVRHIAILLVLTAGSTNQPQGQAAPRASGCTPTKLLPVFTQLGSGFATAAAWPTAIAATIVDDCGNFLKSGSVTASFSNGDPTLSLLSLQDGIWTATWQARGSEPQVTITVRAQQISPALQGSASIGGTVKANPTTPVISAGGAVSAASLASHQPLAPGSFVSIFGANLSAGLNASSSLPFATQLGATQVTMAGKQLPLQFAADNQVNAIIPYDVPANTTQQIIVTNGPAISVPEPVIIAPVQPAVFTNDSSGKAPGSWWA